LSRFGKPETKTEAKLSYPISHVWYIILSFCKSYKSQVGYIAVSFCKSYKSQVRYIALVFCKSYKSQVRYFALAISHICDFSHLGFVIPKQKHNTEAHSLICISVQTTRNGRVEKLLRDLVFKDFWPNLEGPIHKLDLQWKVSGY